MWDYNTILKDLKRLNIPKEYQNIKIDKLFENDYYMMMSIRKDSGKTTNSLLLGLILNYRWGETIEYIRCDENQIRKSSVETMFDVIKEFKYISTLWDDEYNTIIYKPMVKKWYLAYVDKDGKLTKTSDTPVCVMHSLEGYLNIKSTYNNVKGNYIVLDEMLDSSRSTFNQMVELQHTISTIGRYRPENRVICLFNNVNQYSFWWSEFCIEEEIKGLTYGGYFEKKTEYGTTIYCELLDVSSEKRKEIKNKKIRFSGFNTPKMSAFNGLATWQGATHQHLQNEELLNKNNLITNRLYIHHRNRYVQLAYYIDEDNLGEFVFVHFANKPTYTDNIIISLTPTNKWEIFGFGKFAPEHIRDVLYKIIGMRTECRWYYASNSVGDLVDDYFKEME